MSRWARRADANQMPIVQALRAAGCQVVPTHTVGQGFPDLVVKFGSRVMLLEIKDPAKPPSARKLTPAQAEFHEAWSGVIYVVETPEEAVRIATDSLFEAR
ncbi:hypothetical protein C7410_115189 [Paraburkholderia silvatlantica]|uniref:VRR-NUC domain-containing protein n=1 Tax=Paraburkholderia silvatlantica TaxID=321895 RepID=A0A2V4UKQ6_9BURK|nr:hypothetical protein [Paraburkholderia silvatlantica]PYE21346.1 hypothetical protein C7410_115189 [Paraburkholderia silvatlantica]